MRYFTLVLLILCSSLAHAMEVRYQLHMPKPQNHYFEVELLISKNNQKTIDLKLPVWAPGSYLVREFSKNINLVKAFDEKGNSIEVHKIAKNHWQINSQGKELVHIKYEVYAFELSVRTSFLDLSHGYVSGAGVFMYVDGQKSLGGRLDVFPYDDFKKISTALPLGEFEEQKRASTTFTFKDYDQLVDCPIEIGNQEVFEFMAAGVKHTVAMYGEGNYNISDLKRDMAKVIEAETAVFGVNPNKNYLFIIHNVVDGQGGLEHCNSTTLSVNRWTYAGSEYLGFINLVAHEYFHLWNVKRIRPIELGPFDYDHEVYTSLLWVMEGVTSYYDELIMRRAGFYSQETFLNKLMSSINYVEGSVGSRVQPVAHASFDAWIKAYRPTENSANTSMTYYSRGSVLGAVLDAKIISNTKGKKCLDDFMKQLYSVYYVKLNRGFTEAEFKKELSDFMGQDMSDFFARYVDGTEVIPYASIFGELGVKVKETTNSVPSFGASVRDEGGAVMVKSIRAGSAAEEAGLSVNDEIIGCNGYRMSQGMLDGIMNGLSLNDEVELLISRDEILQTVKVKISSYTRPSFSLKSEATPSALYNFWLR